MVKRIIHEKQGLPVPTTKGLPAKASKDTPPALTTEELNPLPVIPSRKRIPRFVWILGAIVAFVIAVQVNPANLKNCLITLAVFATLMPVLRRFRKR